MSPKTLASFIISVLFLGGCLARDAQTRQPAVAGSFYPADPEALTRMVDGYLSGVTLKTGGQPLGLVSPHAGYPFSGPIAAHAFALLKGQKLNRVIIIAPSHLEGFQGVSVYGGDYYQTPLGPIAIDKVFAEKLTSGRSSIFLSDKGHTTRIEGRGEHAVEVQLPFLQRTLGEFKLVPIIIGSQDYETCRTLGLKLAGLIQDHGTVIIASSDLSHYHSYDEATTMDRKTLAAVAEWDYLSLHRNLQMRIWEACGGGPIVATMIATERLGANEARLLSYANSGDSVVGDRKSVVGYAAMAFLKDQDVKAPPQFSLGTEEQERLLEIARRSVETAVREQRLLSCASPGLRGLEQERGAFVTLKRQGQLRGCIGYTVPLKPLFLVVRDVAAKAALSDNRFLPVSPSELSQLDYEISVLSSLRRVTDISRIQIGRHGLLVKKGEREGLLLPQVAAENHWDRKGFLEQTCRKAGLPADAWRDEQTDVFSFTAFVFGQR